MGAPISYSISEIKEFCIEHNAVETYSNGLKVSLVDNPMFFPSSNTYRVGSSEVVGLCSNAIAVGTGQTGSAPLYVFSKDGIYSLFVDSSGELTYTNARVIARDVCNNYKSITPIDDGVVFTTDRGLMMISGNEVVEIGQPVEGDWLKFWQGTRDTNVDYIGVAKNAFESDKLSGFSPLSKDIYVSKEFKEYLENSIVNYNHNERELMVSNINENYTYVMDRKGNWSRRSYDATEYVNNYPTSYRVSDNKLYQVDNGTETTNKFFVLSNVIKLDSIGFKKLDRVIARGYFETPVVARLDANIGLYIFGSHDGRRWACIGHRERKGKFTDIGCLVERIDCKFFRFALAGNIKKESRFDYFEVSMNDSELSTKIR